MRWPSSHAVLQTLPSLPLSLADAGAAHDTLQDPLPHKQIGHAALHSPLPTVPESELSAAVTMLTTMTAMTASTVRSHENVTHLLGRVLRPLPHPQTHWPASWNAFGLHWALPLSNCASLVCIVDTGGDRASWNKFFDVRRGIAAVVLLLYFRSSNSGLITVVAIEVEAYLHTR